MMILEMEALKDAADRPGGWALFKRRTTEKLVPKGWFEPAKHPVYGNIYRITDAGREALTAALQH